MDEKDEKRSISPQISQVPPKQIEFYDPSKESVWTRLGLNLESFKRAPGPTG